MLFFTSGRNGFMGLSLHFDFLNFGMRSKVVRLAWTEPGWIDDWVWEIRLIDRCCDGSTRQGEAEKDSKAWTWSDFIQPRYSRLLVLILYFGSAQNSSDHIPSQRCIARELYPTWLRHIVFNIIHTHALMSR